MPTTTVVSVEFDELVLNRDYGEVTLRAVAGASMVPQVFINGEHIGGSDDLEAYLRSSQRTVTGTVTLTTEGGGLVGVELRDDEVESLFA